MPEAPSPPPPQEANLLIGRAALEQGLITRDQLQDGMREQARDAAAGRVPRPLGAILVHKGYLTGAQLAALAEAQPTHPPQPARAQPHPDDVLLGNLLIRHGLASAPHIQECLHQQTTELERGAAPVRLGELLIQKGYATQEAISRVLTLQQKTILSCPGCGTKYNVAGYADGKDYRCRKCDEVLVPPKHLDTVHVEGSAPAWQAVPADDLPPEVSAAAKNPLSHFGKYILVKELGRGGMGVVYKAWQTDLRRAIALKLLSSRSSSSVGLNPSATDEEVKRFYREAQTAAKLKHPNIVSIFEVGQHQSHYFLSMEYIEGVTLERWIRSGKLQQEAAGEASRRPSRTGAAARRAAEIVRDVALAVQTAHDQQIVHRDLKPQNILMDAEGRPHVTDFGLAKSTRTSRKDAATLTVSGVILGTPAYMSPEQASGGKVPLDTRSDVYSLGTVLYETLCGRPPFGGGTSLDIVMQVLKTDPPPPSQVAKHPVPRDLEIICIKAMEKDRERRYPTAAAFAADLDRWLQGEAILARPQSTWYRLNRKVKSNPVAASVLAAAAVALIALAALSVFGTSERSLRREQLAKLLRDGREKLEQRKYDEAQVRYSDAVDLARSLGRADEEAEAQQGLNKCAAEIRRAGALRRQEIAELHRKLEELQKLGAQATTEEEKRKIVLAQEELAKQIAARGGSGTPVAAVVPPPTPATALPPAAVTPPPPAPAAAPPAPPPASPAPGPVAPFQGDGPKLIAAHRYGELYERLRRNRDAFGPVSDAQVAWARSAADLCETLQLNKERFKGAKPRIAFPSLKSMGDQMVEASIQEVDLAKGDINLQIRMRNGASGTISESIAGLTTAQFIDLVRFCVKEDDAPTGVRCGGLYALHGDYDGAVAALLRARQLGASVDAELAGVAAAACALPAGKGSDDLRKQADAIQGLLEKHGKALPEAVRAQIEAAAASIKSRVSAAEADELYRKAEAEAGKGRIREAFDLIEKVTQKYPGTQAASDAAALALKLPHPDGRLLNGFERAEDLEGWGKSKNASFQRVTDPAQVKEGQGALKAALTSQVVVGQGMRQTFGALIGFVADDIPFERARALSVWVRSDADVTGRVYFACYTTPNDYYYAEVSLERNWKQVRLIPQRCAKDGNPDWKRIQRVGFAYFGNGTAEFMIDSLRLQE